MPRRTANWVKRIDGWIAGQKRSRESEICARLDPGSADAHYRLAQIYEHVQQSEKQRKEIKLYEAASTRVADENARREATMKTFLYTMRKEAQEQKETPDHR